MNFGRQSANKPTPVASFFSARPVEEDETFTNEVVPEVPSHSPLTSSVGQLALPPSEARSPAVASSQPSGGSLMANMLRAKAARDLVSQRAVASKAEGIAEQAGPSVMRVRTEDYLAAQGWSMTATHQPKHDPFHFEIEGAADVRQQLREERRKAAIGAAREPFPLGALLLARSRLKRAREELRETCFAAELQMAAAERAATTTVGRLR